MHHFIAIIQAILHYLGWIGIILGIIAFMFGNKIRGQELLLGGISFIVLKYIIGIIYFVAIGVIEKLKLLQRRNSRDGFYKK
jgi:hydrogenase-4 membrane subunit HyfE